MILNSIAFTLFFSIFLVPYFSVRDKVRAQNSFVLLASYVFYGWTDWRMVGLLFLATVIFMVLH